jgi:hypothetical protein
MLQAQQTRAEYARLGKANWIDPERTGENEMAN